MKNNTEAPRFNPEQSKNSELEKAGVEHRERLREQLERAGEKSHENDEQSARHEALERATSVEHEATTVAAERQPSPAERRGPVSKAEREASFNATMNEVQSQMNTSSRAFSKVIHAKPIEKASEVTGATIARPNAILSGAVFAFALTLVVYLVAKNIGYPLSGFESIGAFILGWLLGIAYDFIKAMVTGRR